MIDFLFLLSLYAVFALIVTVIFIVKEAIDAIKDDAWLWLAFIIFFPLIGAMLHSMITER